MIKGAIFDLDGTLYDYSVNDVIAMKELCRFVQEKFNVGENEFRKIFDEAKRVVKIKLKDGGSRHSRILYCQAALELMGENPFEHTVEMSKIYWNEFLRNMKLYDGALEFLQDLKKSNIKTAICTDMTAYIQYIKIKRLGISHLFDAIVTSEETGVEKPSPMMFELALDKLKINASETAYFGDSLERDVEGAANCGIKTFWFIADRKVDETVTNYTKVKSYRDFRF